MKWLVIIGVIVASVPLKITEHGEIYNPLVRFVARFFLEYERTMTAYLTSLEKHFAGVARAS